MATLHQRNRPFARAGEFATGWIRLDALTKRKEASATSGSTSCLLYEPYEQMYFSPHRSVAKAGRGGQTTPMLHSDNHRRKVDVYDLCLMIDSSAERE